MALAHSYATQYQSMEVKTADPLELVILLYKGAIKETRQARSHLEAGRTGPRVASINKAIAIIGELKACLDSKKGGEIARSLDRLYTYMIGRLTAANFEQDAGALDEVARLLENLLSGWEGAHAKQSEQQGAQHHLTGGGAHDRLTLTQESRSLSFSF